MATINPYITFNGNCEEAFTYYKSIFGGDFRSLNRFNEMPPQEGQPVMSEEEGIKIMHISLPISKETILMGSDTGGEWASKHIVGNNITLGYTPNTREEADRVYQALAKGGVASMPMAEQFWGDYFGMCTDQFGINWMVTFGGNM